MNALPVDVRTDTGVAGASVCQTVMGDMVIH